MNPSVTYVHNDEQEKSQKDSHGYADDRYFAATMVSVWKRPERKTTLSPGYIFLISTMGHCFLWPLMVKYVLDFKICNRF